MIPGLAQWVKDLELLGAVVYVVDVGSDLVLLWLWHRPTATAPIRPLIWEPPYAAGTALKRQNKQTPPPSLSGIQFIWFYLCP